MVPVVQRVDNFIQWITCCPVDKMHWLEYILSAGQSGPDQFYEAKSLGSYGGLQCLQNATGIPLKKDLKPTNLSL